MRFHMAVELYLFCEVQSCRTYGLEVTEWPILVKNILVTESTN